MKEHGPKNFLKKTAAAGVAVLGLSLGANASEASFISSPEDSTKISEYKQLTHAQMDDWNKFVDFVEAEGYKDSPELDVKDQTLIKNLYDKFKREHPDVSFDLSIISAVQFAMQRTRDDVQKFAERHKNPDAKKLMKGISKIDGWAGSKTTHFKFPRVREEEYVDGNLITRSDLGYINGDFTTTKQIRTKGGVVIPKGVMLEKMADNFYYFLDPDSGDYKRVK